MEDSERDLIRSRLCDLILHTNCSTDFLTFFHEKGIFKICDIESIAAKNEGSDRASEFYKIIVTRTSGFQKLIEALEKTRQVKPLQILEGENVSLSVEEVRKRVEKLLRDESKTNIFFDVDPPVHLFTGRKTELEELHQMILKSKEGKTLTVISQLATVSGLGGIGKTQLARQYISDKSSFFNENVIWLNAEHQGSLSTSFRRLGTEKLGISTKDGNGTDKSAKTVAEEVYKYFEERKALFVFDNAALKEDSGPWLRDLLPNPKKNPDLYILMTSRNREWGVGAKVMSLGELTQAEAVSMVRSGLEIEDEDSEYDEAIIKLTETLQCFPLALHQAILYIYEQKLSSGKYSIWDFISEFKNKKQAMMLSYRDVDSLDDTYMLTTATTWKITVDKIRAHPELGAIAISLLEVMSYYNPTNIWRDILYYPMVVSALSLSHVATTTREKLAKQMVNALMKPLVEYCSVSSAHSYTYNPTNVWRDFFYLIKADFDLSHIKPITIEEINGSIRLLVKYSMINSTSQDQSVLSIHRLVQAVTRLQIERNGETTPFYAAVLCLLSFCHDEGDTFHVKNIEHGLAVWRHSWKHPSGILPLKALIIIVLIKMLECGRVSEGLDFCNEVLTKCKEVSRAEEFCFSIRKYQAWLVKMKGCKEEAVNLNKSLLDEARKIFGEESEEFQSVELDISETLKSLGENVKDKDLDFMVKEFNKRKYKLGANDKSTLNAQDALAVYQMDNELDNEALETLKDLIDKCKTVYGADSAETLEAEAKVATIYFKIGKKEEALQLFQAVHEKFLQFPETYSGQSTNICVNYADMLAKVGRAKDAVNVLENFNKTLKKVYGNQHLWMSALLNKIGDFQHSLAKFKEALDNHSEALRIERATFRDTPISFVYKKSVAFDLLYLGKIKESMYLLDEVQDALGTLNLVDINRFVLVLKTFGHDLEALELVFRIKNSKKSELAEANTEIETFSEELNHIRQKIEMEKEIKNICKSALQRDIKFKKAWLKLSDMFDVDGFEFSNQPALFALNVLFVVRLRLYIKNLKYCLMILQTVYDALKIYLMINQKQTINTLIGIGDLYFGMKNYEQALDYHKQAYEKLSDIHGDLYVTTIETKIRIATDLFCKGSHDESLLIFKEIAETLQQLEEHNPNENDLTLNMLNYAVETVTILFRDHNSHSNKVLADIRIIQDIVGPKVLKDQFKCADDFITRGNYEEALKMYKDVYQNGDSPIWKADMCEIASTSKDLGHVLSQLGEHEEALEILEGNLELVKTNLGSEHHWTYLLQGSLASALRGLGDFEEALKLHEEAYQGILINLDEDHEEVLILRKEIAVDLSFLGRNEESICLFLEILHKLEAVSGKESYNTIFAKIELAEAIERSNEDFTDAFEIVENLNTIMPKVIDKESLLFKNASRTVSKIRDKLTPEQGKH